MIVNGFDGRKWKTPHSSTVRDRPLSLITVDIIPIAIDVTSQETFIFFYRHENLVYLNTGMHVWFYYTCISEETTRSWGGGVSLIRDRH